MKKIALLLFLLVGLAANGQPLSPGTSGGVGSATNAIVLLNGFGTNTQFYTVSGQAGAPLTFHSYTNTQAGISLDSLSVQGQLNNTMFEFWGCSLTNTPGLVWSSAIGLGDEAYMVYNLAHGGLGEFQCYANGNWALVGGAASNPWHFQIGGLQGRTYLNYGISPNTTNAMAYSGLLDFVAGYNTNGTIMRVEPGFMAFIDNTNAGEFRYSIDYHPDEGGVDPVSTNNYYHEQSTLSLYTGTNSAVQYFQGVRLTGIAVGQSTNIIDVSSNQINIKGNLVATNPTDSWQAPNTFTAGTSAALQVSGSSVLVGVNASGQIFTVQNAAGGLANAMFRSGPGLGGNVMPVGGLAIGTTAVVNAGDVFEVYGNSYVPTNVAPFTVVSNFSPATSTLYTNLSGARVKVSCTAALTAGSSGTGSANTALLIINYTNNGVGFPSIQPEVANSSAVTNYSQIPFSFDLATNGTFKMTTTVIGNGSAVGFIGNMIFVTE